MKIIFDAMGGDNAPEANIKGLYKFIKESEAHVILVGKEEKLNEISKRLYNKNITEMSSKISVVNAEEEIVMEDIPTKAIREKKNSSMVIGMNMVKNGEGDVFVSAGNSGALLTGSTLIIGRIKNVIRPALAGILPSVNGNFMLMDCGANTNCKIENFAQFGQMASVYMANFEGRQNPTVGLLNIGTEENKGNDLYKEVYHDLKNNKDKYNINFIGNIEARAAFMGKVDILIADGFTGNVFLKTVEGLGKMLKQNLQDTLLSSFFGKLCLIPIYPKLSKFLKRMDYKRYGGGLFLGVKKPVVKAHGSSDEKLFYYTLKQAETFVKSRVVEKITEEMEKED